MNLRSPWTSADAVAPDSAETQSHSPGTHGFDAGSRRAVGVAALVVVLAAGFAVLATRGGSTASRPQPEITVAMAQRVVPAIWRKREFARANDNERALAEVDSGPELRRDDSVTRGARDMGLSTERVVRPLGPFSIAIRGGAGFPESFLAAVQTTNQFSSGPSSNTPEGGETALLVFRKPTRTAPWKVAMETAYEGTLEELGPEN